MLPRPDAADALCRFDEWEPAAARVADSDDHDVVPGFGDQGDRSGFGKLGGLLDGGEKRQSSDEDTPSFATARVEVIDLEGHDLVLDQLGQAALTESKDDGVAVTGVVGEADRPDNRWSVLLGDRQTADEAVLGRDGEQAPALWRLQHLGASLVDPHDLTVFAA